MTQEEKAKELVDKFEKILRNSNADIWTTPAKQCAIICVDEIMGNVPNQKNALNDEDFDWWNGVKTAINNL